MFCRQKHLPKCRRRFVKNWWRLFDQKLNIPSSSDYPIMFKFCEFVAQTLNMELQIEFYSSDVSFCNGNTKFPIETSIFLHGFLPSSFFMFPLLLLTVLVQNTSCNSLPTTFTTMWQILNKIEWSELHKIGIFWQKPGYYVNHFWYTVSAILKEVLYVKQIMML